jgi:ribonuclease HI
MTVVIFTDGGAIVKAKGETGPGGWGWHRSGGGLDPMEE